MMMWIMINSSWFLVPPNPFFARLQASHRALAFRRFNVAGKGKGKGKYKGNVKGKDFKVKPEPEPIGLDKFGKPVFWSAAVPKVEDVEEDDAVTVAGREVEEAGRELRIALQRLADRHSQFPEMTVATVATPCRLMQGRLVLALQLQARARARRYVQ
jgi:hypothetical protein